MERPKIKIFGKKIGKKADKTPSPSTMEELEPESVPPPANSPRLVNRRNAIVSLQRMSPTPLDRSRREAAMNFPHGGVSRVLPPRSRSSGPPGRVENTTKFRLDVMDDIAKYRSKKVRLRMDETSTEDEGSSPQRYTQRTKRYTQRSKQRSAAARRTQSAAPTFSLQKSVSERPTSGDEPIPGTSGIARVARSAKRALNSLSFSSVDTERSESTSSEDRSSWLERITKQKDRLKKSLRSKSLDMGLIRGIKDKFNFGLPKRPASATSSPSQKFGRHKTTTKEKVEKALNLDLTSQQIKNTVLQVIFPENAAPDDKVRVREKKKKSKEKKK